MYSDHCTAGERGAIAGVDGRWRVEGGVERSAVSWSGVARACIETREKHEWALSIWPPDVG